VTVTDEDVEAAAKATYDDADLARANEIIADHFEWPGEKAAALAQDIALTFAAIRHGSALQAYASRKGEGREVGWLIERKDDGDFREPHWYVEDSAGWHEWTRIASNATRFTSKAEAEQFEPYRLIASDPHISLTEHVFLSGAHPPSADAEGLREALTALEGACEAVAAGRSEAAYRQMMSDGQADALLALDEARRNARAALKTQSPPEPGWNEAIEQPGGKDD
jgi:hypothetical protein